VPETGFGNKQAEKKIDVKRNLQAIWLEILPNSNPVNNQLEIK